MSFEALKALERRYGRVHQTADEERADIVAAQAGDRDAMDRLIRAMSFQIFRTARVFGKRGADPEEIAQECALGVVEAIVRFDVASDHRLFAYAKWWIVCYARRYAAGNMRAISLPVSEALSRATMAHGKSYEERVQAAAEARGTTRDRAESIVSLLESTRCDPELQGAEARASGPTPESAAAASEIAEIVEEALGSLSPRHADVIRARFGIGCDEETLQGLGDRMGVTRERVRQIETKSLARLREHGRLRAAGEAP